MNWDVATAEPLDNYRLRVGLEDGRSGIVDMSPYLDKGVFRELQDPDYFRQVHVFLGALTWPHGQDVAPETVFNAVTGEDGSSEMVAEKPKDDVSRA